MTVFVNLRSRDKAELFEAVEQLKEGSLTSVKFNEQMTMLAHRNLNALTGMTSNDVATDEGVTKLSSELSALFNQMGIADTDSVSISAGIAHSVMTDLMAPAVFGNLESQIRNDPR